MDAFTRQTRRIFDRVEAVLEAIESGRNPDEALRRLNDAAPCDVVRLGQMFVANQEKEARKEC